MPKVFFDVDGTIIHGRTQMIALSHLWKKHQVSFFFPIKILFGAIKYKILSFFQEVEFIPQIMQDIYSCLEGKDVSEVEKFWEEIFQTKIKPKMIQKTIQILKQHQKQEDEIILISTSIEPLIKLIGDYLGIDKIIASKLEINKGKYTGQITHAIHKEEKLKAAKDLSDNLKQSFFYTNSYSDISLLEQAGRPVAVNPDYKLRKKVQKENWPILNF